MVSSVRNKGFSARRSGMQVIRHLLLILTLSAMIGSVACVGSNNVMQMIGNKPEVKMIGKTYGEITVEYGSLSMAYLEGGELYCLFEGTSISFVFDRSGIETTVLDGDSNTSMIVIPTGAAAKNIDTTAVCISVYGSVKDYGIENPEILSSAVKDTSKRHAAGMDYYLFQTGDAKTVIIIPGKGSGEITADSEIKVSFQDEAEVIEEITIEVSGRDTSITMPMLPSDPPTDPPIDPTDPTDPPTDPTDPPNDPTDPPTEPPTPEPSGYPMKDGKAITSVNSLRKHDSVFFGTYEQDGNSANGAEPIEWRVLQVSGSKALLITEKIIESKPFNDTYKKIRWRKSDLRTWLNGSFLDNAFSSEERKLISEEEHLDSGNERFDVMPGSETNDYVFLLDVEEVGSYFSSDSDRAAKATEYVLRLGQLEAHDGYGWWWLRNAGVDTDHASLVYYGGSVYSSGDAVSRDYYGVRPAIWIKLD